MITTKDWKGFFPYPKIRPQQEEAINFIINEFEKDKKFVIAELGTGIGKSAIGYTIANYFNSKNRVSKSYFLTTQKILQDQYVKDFGEPNGEMISLKSKSNYKCQFYKELNCEEAFNLLKREENLSEKSDFYKKCNKGCIHKKTKKKFKENHLSLTNFLFFLTDPNIEKRNFLVVDECHHIENVLSSFIEVSISNKFCQDRLNINIPQFPITQSKAFYWIKDILKGAVAKERKDTETVLNKMEQISQNHLLIRASNYTKKYQRIKRLDDRIRDFLKLYHPNNWVMNLYPEDGRNSRRIGFKPIYVNSYAKNRLLNYGERVLMMSATILDKEIYMKSLGIEPEEASFLSIDSPFPVKNKPIFYISSGKMSRKEIDKNLPNLVKNIKQLIDMHKDEKGIIHTHSYKISTFIKDNIKNKRLIFHNEKNRDEMLEKHKNSKKPTILVSPSMNEGVDLKDELSRFQIICKLPFPYLGDKINQRKMKNDKKWYDFMTAKSIIQSVGRSIRNENDYAITYILDECWGSFYSRNLKLFPNSFKKAITD